jgi:hypothetical protein
MDQDADQATGHVAEVAYHQLTYDNELVQFDANLDSNLGASEVETQDLVVGGGNESTNDSNKDVVFTDEEQRARAERRKLKRARRMVGVTVHLLAGLLLLSLATRFVPSTAIASPLLRGSTPSPLRFGVRSGVRVCPSNWQSVHARGWAQRC